MTTSSVSKHISFDGILLHTNDIVYQITLVNDENFALVPYRVHELVNTTNIKVIKQNTNSSIPEITTINSNQVCVDPIFLINKWVEINETLRDKTIPARLQSLSTLRDEYGNLSLPPEINTGLNESIEL